MKRIGKAKRAFLLAVVRGEVCGRCQSAPAVRLWGLYGNECGPCEGKRVDAQQARKGESRWD